MTTPADREALIASLGKWQRKLTEQNRSWPPMISWAEAGELGETLAKALDALAAPQPDALNEEAIQTVVRVCYDSVPGEDGYEASRQDALEIICAYHRLGERKRELPEGAEGRIEFECCDCGEMFAVAPDVCPKCGSDDIHTCAIERAAPPEGAEGGKSETQCTEVACHPCEIWDKVHHCCLNAGHALIQGKPLTGIHLCVCGYEWKEAARIRYPRGCRTS